MHEGPRAFTLMWNRGGVVRAQIIRRGRRSRPVTPAEAVAGLRPMICMHINARGLRPRAFTCMHVRGRGPAEAEAGVIGQDSRPSQACSVQG
eukprot:364813-Chlamydomonas_euryale.AAC.5